MPYCNSDWISLMTNVATHLFMLVFDFLHVNFQILFLLIFMYERAYVAACRSQKRMSDSWNWRYRQLLVAIWVMGIKYRACGRAANILKCWASSPAPILNFKLVKWRMSLYLLWSPAYHSNSLTVSSIQIVVCFF